MEQKLKKEDNIVLIGNKGFMSYISAISYQFLQQEAEEVIIKARGKYTARAIDVAEVASKKFLQGVIKVTDVMIDSLEHEIDNKKIRVSVIEIRLRKNE